jgi:drug/metabolite transporter (DMT)-like permease
MLRAALSAPIMLAWVSWMKGWGAGIRAQSGAVAGAMTAGFVCYGFGALLDFYALSIIDASVERVLLFSYPSMVVIFGSLLGRAWPTRRAIVSVLATYAGIFLVMGGLDGRVLLANLHGSGLVLTCAATYTLYFFIGERCTREIGSLMFAALAMSSAAVGLIVYWALRHDVRAIHLDGRSWQLMVAMVVLSSVLPMFMTAEGVRRIGAQRSALVSTLGPIATVLFAATLLGERLSVSQLAGGIHIIAAVLTLELLR